MRRNLLSYYILNADHSVRETHCVHEWGRFLENITNRLVDWTQVNSECHVSTIFIGLDHRFAGDGPPILFESLVFGGPCDGDGRRYSSWDDAETGHKMLVKKVRAAYKVGV
jgi:hypothetical protein